MKSESDFVASIVVERGDICKYAYIHTCTHIHVQACSSTFSRSIDCFIYPLLFIIMCGRYRRTYCIFMSVSFLLFWHWMSCLLEPLTTTSLS